jgi:hypothetical protein
MIDDISLDRARKHSYIIVPNKNVGPRSLRASELTRIQASWIGLLLFWSFT